VLATQWATIEDRGILMMVIEKKLGAKVAGMRRNSGLTQAQLAEKVGVATETISRMERGTAMPSLARLDRVAAALGYDMFELFRFQEKPGSREDALERLMAAARRRTADDIEVIIDIALRIFARWAAGGRMPRHSLAKRRHR
jgi:transcriptional regulator with XRE-family HTH domain